LGRREENSPFGAWTSVEGSLGSGRFGNKVTRTLVNGLEEKLPQREKGNAGPQPLREKRRDGKGDG